MSCVYVCTHYIHKITVMIVVTASLEESGQNRCWYYPWSFLHEISCFHICTIDRHKACNVWKDTLQLGRVLSIPVFFLTCVLAGPRMRGSGVGRLREPHSRSRPGWVESGCGAHGPGAPAVNRTEGHGKALTRGCWAQGPLSAPRLYSAAEFPRLSSFYSSVLTINEILVCLPS